MPGTVETPSALITLNLLNVPLWIFNNRIRTYEHEAMWGKALTSYDLHSSLPEGVRHVGIVEVNLSYIIVVNIDISR